MDKNWLIRTKSNNILGPISKEKVLELYQNGSIKLDDEVCSGNGFWFFLREEDMVERFVVGDEVQGFNPISEAKDILTQSHVEPEAVSNDITLVGGINLAMLKEKPAPTPVPEKTEAPKVELEIETNPELKLESQVETKLSLEIESEPEPKLELEPEKKIEEPKPTPVVTVTKEAKPLEVQKKNNGEVKQKRETKSVSKKPLKRQGYLKYLGIIGFLLLFLLVYFRKTIIRSLMQGKTTDSRVSFLSVAHAQEETSDKKKSY